MLYPLCFVSRIRRKAGGPVSQPFYIINKLWDVKERTHCSQRVGHVVPGVVVYLDLCRRRSGWVRCDHNGLKRLPEAPLICWRPISPLWFLRNSALGCKWAPFIYLSSTIYHLSSETGYRYIYIYIYIYIYVCMYVGSLQVDFRVEAEQNKYYERKTRCNYISRQACFVNRFTLQGFNERIFMWLSCIY